MVQARSASSDFNRAFGDAKKQASNLDLAGEASDASRDVYEHARDTAADLADSANEAARQTAGSLERALRNTIETQPYTAVAIALGLGWLLGRTHRPF
jgi:ElaB/YqjD/DUF883 family membrane-anchored ribosome-binding protein